jgi:hypothetical protein
MISNQALGCIKGDNAVFEIDMTTAAGPVDLTGATAQWVLAESWFDGAKTFLAKTSAIGGGVTITNDAGTWKLVIQLTPADTLAVPSGMLFHDCKVTLSDASVAHVASGPFTLEPSVNP